MCLLSFYFYSLVFNYDSYLISFHTLNISLFSVVNCFVLNIVKLPFRVKFLFVINIVSYVCCFVFIPCLIYYVFLFHNFLFSLSLFSFSCFILFGRTFKSFFWA